MDIVLVLVGIVVGAVIALWLVRVRDRMDHDALRAEVAETYDAKGAAERARIVRAYESQIAQLQADHRENLTQARRSSVNQSRAVLKGKMAEQVAPLLPGFTYWPADARFLGDPVDYVVFDGYSAYKDNYTDGHDIEVVILDIKRGKSQLTREQRRIAEAVSAGRVRFEMIRVLADGTVHSRRWTPSDDLGATPSQYNTDTESEL
ncbi:MAG: endonuclease [Anaerolineae bacterium]|nr:endonuclease [Anaerolineae bacterium]